jgi:Tfp pilus assembly pilus retraction ATPase PilT
MRMRFVKIVGEGETWASLRAVPLDVPEFSKIGLHPEFTRMMRSLAKKKGLIIVGGSTGDGKTTTCVSLLIHYLKQHGGLLFTLEDPPEWAIHGTVAENAFCLQHKIEDNEDWNQAAKSAMRSRPDYILFGEIRTPEAAENLIKTLTSGHLVVATIHAGQVSDTIAALMQLAEHKLGKVARENLADRLLAAIHQTLTSDGPRIECVVPVTKSDSERQQLIDTIKGGTYTNISKAVKVFEPARKVAREMKRA